MKDPEIHYVPTLRKQQAEKKTTHSLSSIVQSKYQYKVFIFLKNIPPQPRQQCVHHSHVLSTKAVSKCTQMK